VTERRDGARRVYRIHTEGLAALRAYLEAYWHDALAAFKEVAEERGG
jgi:hypothetical protein